MTVDEAALFGRGFGFPPRLGPDGRWAWSEGVENVRQSIRVILSTEGRERLMLPQFGGGLRRFLFQPNTPATHRLIEKRITESLGRWERRINLESVDVAPDPESPQAAIATLHYRLVATHEPGVLRLRIVLESIDTS